MDELQNKSERVDQLMNQYGKPFIDDQHFSDPHLTDQQIKDDYTNLLRAFLSAFVVATSRPISQLSKQEIIATVDTFDQLLPTGDDYTLYFENSVRTGATFLIWLSDKGIVSLTPQQIANAFNERTMAASMDEMPMNIKEGFDTYLVDRDREAYHYDRPSLTAYQDGTAGNIRITIGQTAQALFDSPQFKSEMGQITHGYTLDIFDYLIGMASHLYGEFRKTPKSWTKKALKSVLTGYLIKDATIRPEEYPETVTILKMFMDVAAQEHVTTKTIAERMKRAIDEVAPEMIQLGKNRRHFSNKKKGMLADMDEDHTLKDEQDDQPSASETATSPTSNPSKS
ncbi:hypothetical protein ACFQ22_01725 [Lentilactobacillus raoultii]|uniref:Uncharacterized protein n=1 Tax=Lentilactobacillus raoultii TaxID=1987503 RepID=A0ABW3PL21_9LACO|nr:hypothetical protein [Lentilactobacillus raoultii]